MNQDLTRQPVEGDPDLLDMVHPGDYIQSSRGTEGLVVEVQRYEYNVGETVSAYCILFWSRRKLEHLAISDRVSLTGLSMFNEVVVHQGKLCKLFEANEETFEIVPIPPDVIIPERAWAFLGKPQKGQLVMF